MYQVASTAIQTLVAWHSTAPQLQKKLLPSIAVCVILAITLAGASYYQGTLPPSPSPPSYGSTTTPSPPSPTSTSSLNTTIKPGDTIYQADFTNHANEWPGGRVVGGALVFNTNDTNPPLVLPASIILTTADYEVDAKIKILDDSGYPCGNIGIFARSTESSAYESILKLCENGSYPHVAIDACSMNVIAYCSDNSTYDFSPQPETPFTLSLEVQGLHIALLLNGTKVASQDLTIATAPGQAGVIAQQVNAEILSFKIVAV